MLVAAVLPAVLVALCVPRVVLSHRMLVAFMRALLLAVTLSLRIFAFVASIALVSVIAHFAPDGATVRVELDSVGFRIVVLFIVQSWIGATAASEACTGTPRGCGMAGWIAWHRGAGLARFECGGKALLVLIFGEVVRIRHTCMHLTRVTAQILPHVIRQLLRVGDLGQIRILQRVGQLDGGMLRRRTAGQCGRRDPS